MLGNILGKEPVELENESRIITQRATGEVLTLEGTAEANYKGFKVYGKSWQETRDDKNLLEPIEFDKTIENNFTLSARDGIYSINGTVPIYAAQQFGWRLTTSYRGANYTTYINNTDVTFILSPGTYTVSVKFLGGTINNTEDRVHLSYRLDNTSGGGSVNGYTVGEITKTTKINEVISRTFTLEEDTPFTVFASVLRLYENSTYNNVRWVIQLEKGEVATDYQPYGIMPSPEFPSQINAVAGNINMLDISTLELGYVNSDGSINSNHNNGEAHSIFIEVLPNTFYYLSLVETETTLGDWLAIGEYSENTYESFIKRDNTSRKSFVFKTTEHTHYVIVSGRNFEKATKILFKKHDGNIGWSPYGQGSLLICNSNSNLANVDLLYKEMKAYNSQECREEIIDGKNCIVFYNYSYQLGYGFQGLSQRYKRNTQYKLKLKGRIYDTTRTTGYSLYIHFVYDDGTETGTGHYADGENWIDFELISKANKTIDCIAFSYGSGAYWAIDKDSFIIEEYVEGQEAEYVPNEEQDVVISLPQLYGLKTNDETLANYTDESGQKWIADYLAPDGIHRRTYKVRVTRDNWFNSGFNGGAGSIYADWQNATFGIVSAKFGTEFPKFIKGHALCTIAPYGVGGERR